jgi:hypothetical protein
MGSDAVKEGSMRRLYWPLFALAISVLLLPVIGTRYSHLVDFPNHLTRAYILHHYDDVPRFATTFARIIEPLPNLALDLIIPPMLSVVGVLTAGKIFVVLTILVFAAGCHLLGGAMHGGRPSWTTIPALFLSTGSAFLFGFLNYLFGVGLFMIAVALWLRLRPRWTAARQLLMMLVVLAAFIAHLSAYAFVGITLVTCVAMDVFQRRRSWRMGALDLLPLVPTLALFILFMRGSGDTGIIKWNSVTGKIIGLATVIRSYDDRLDIVVVTVLLLAAAIVLRQSTRLTVRKPFVAAAVILLLAYVASPMVLFTSWAADTRFVLPAVLLLLLAIDIEMPRRSGALLLATVSALFVVRSSTIWSTWRSLDPPTACAIRLLDRLPVGATVFPAFFASEDLRVDKRTRAFEHVVQYATVTRRAYVPTLFAMPGQQPLVFRQKPPFDEWTAERGAALYAQYDYVWAYNEPAALRRELGRTATLVGETDGFSLWAVQPPDPDGYVLSR